ncbi:MAG: hypothetical protein R3231_03745 [bacterium]|nr:hypothetical protein [bacterium]
MTPIDALPLVIPTVPVFVPERIVHVVKGFIVVRKVVGVTVGGGQALKKRIDLPS